MCIMPVTDPRRSRIAYILNRRTAIRYPRRPGLPLPRRAAGAGKRPGRYRAGRRAGGSASRGGLVAGLYESGFVGEYDCLDAVADAELAEYPGHVRLDGGLAEEQPVSDLGVRQPAGDQLQDVELALGQLGEALAARDVARRAADVSLDQALGDGGCEQRFAGCDRSDRFGERTVSSRSVSLLREDREGQRVGQDGVSDSDPRTLAEYVRHCPKIFVR